MPRFWSKGVEITEKVAEVVVFPGAVSAVLVEMGGGANLRCWI